LSDSFDKIMQLALGLIIGGAVIGAAITSIATQNTSGWGTASIAMWAIVGVMGAALFLYVLYKGAK